MKKLKIISLFLFFLILCYGVIFAETNTNKKLLTVNGEATVNVVPDEVVIFLGVVTINKDIKLAKSQNDEIIKKIIKITNDFEIMQKDIQVDYLTIYPKYDYSYNKNEFIGYEVKKNLSIILEDIKKYESLISILLSNGVTNIYNIDFKTSELRKYKDQARLLAINACIEKANLIASGFKVKIGNPYNVVEEQLNWFNFNNYSQNIIQEQNNYSNNISSIENNSIIGQISIKAKITASFEIQ